jgi:ribosomal-protein-alanine N-acetyltransferase
VGRQLVSALVGEARASRARVVLLEVRASNAPALALYTSLGFSELDRRPDYYTHPDEDAVVMQLSLR